MVIPSLIKELYQETETRALEQIRESQKSIALMAQIRERSGEDWEIEELARSIIFEEVQFVEIMKGEADAARERLAELPG